MFPAASGPYAEPGILRVPQRNFCRATRRMPGSVGLHQREPEPHGRRRAEQDQVPAGLGQCGPDESQMPQVRPGLLPLLCGHIGPRGDAGEFRAGEQAGRPGHDWIGGEKQWQRWGRAGCVGRVDAFERGGTHAHQSGGDRREAVVDVVGPVEGACTRRPVAPGEPLRAGTFRAAGGLVLQPGTSHVYGSRIPVPDGVECPRL